MPVVKVDRRLSAKVFVFANSSFEKLLPHIARKAWPKAQRSLTYGRPETGRASVHDNSLEWECTNFP